ncbi:unnamed protein product [Mytilus edulis]|uniref:Uncharacterized protein n=1 Tax=Mytilus edulis TaxID=6550 RepID=A0A8S3SEC5_MYTED|nr:unnamed protein product [Mytilus edulis]
MGIKFTGCSASITTDPEGTAVVKTKNTHSHDRDEHKAETRQLRVRVRQNSGDISQRPSQVIRGELQKMDENLLNHQDLKNVAMSLYRERRKQFPKLPKSRLEIQETLRQMDLNTSKTESFTLVNDLDSGIVIFSCFTNLECLCNEMTDIFIDGTFKSCPKFFYQLSVFDTWIKKQEVAINTVQLVTVTDVTQKSKMTLAESKDQEVTITIDGINRSINKLLMLGAKPVVYTTFREYDDENKILIRQSVEEGGCHIDEQIDICAGEVNGICVGNPINNIQEEDTMRPGDAVIALMDMHSLKDKDVKQILNIMNKSNVNIKDSYGKKTFGEFKSN